MNITAISVIFQLMSSIHLIPIQFSSQSESQLSLPTHNIKYKNHSSNFSLHPTLNLLESSRNQVGTENKKSSQIIIIDAEEEIQDHKETNKNEKDQFDLVQIQREEFRSNTNPLKKLMNKAFKNTQQLEQRNRETIKTEENKDKKQNLERQYQRQIDCQQKSEIADKIAQNVLSISSEGFMNSNQVENSNDLQAFRAQQGLQEKQKIIQKQDLRECIQKCRSSSPKLKQNIFMREIDEKKKNTLSDQNLTEVQIEKLANLNKFKDKIFITKLFVVNILLLNQLIQYFGSVSMRNQSDIKLIQQSHFEGWIADQADQDDDVGYSWKLTQTRQNMLKFMYTFLQALIFTDYGLLKLFIYQCSRSQIQQIYKSIISEIRANARKISNLKSMNPETVQYCLKKILSIPLFQRPKSEKQMRNFLKESYLAYSVSNISLLEQPEEKSKEKYQKDKKYVTYAKNTIFMNQQDKIKQKSPSPKNAAKNQQIKHIKGTPKFQIYLKKLQQKKERVTNLQLNSDSRKKQDKNQDQKIQMGKAKQKVSSQFPKRRLFLTFRDYNSGGTQKKNQSPAEQEIQEGEILQLSQASKKKH